MVLSTSIKPCDYKDLCFCGSVVKGDAPDYILGLFRCVCSDLAMSGCIGDHDNDDGGGNSNNVEDAGYIEVDMMFRSS